MPRTRPTSSSTLSISLCLALSYALTLTTICAPFVVPSVKAATGARHSFSLSPTLAGDAATTERTAATRSSASTASSSNGSGSNGGNNGGGGHRAGELIVRFRATVSEQEKNSSVENHGAHRSKKLRGDSGIEKLAIPAGQDAESAAADLRTNPAIEFVEPNYIVTKDDTTPNDPAFAQQWALHNSLNPNADIGVMPAWDTTTGSSSTVIAVIDSGIDFSHPDLANNEWTNTGEIPNNNKDDDRDGLIDDVHGWDYITNSPTIKDEQGHGTAIAGIIAAEGNNAAGTSGVMWHASLMSLRVLDGTGSGDIASAVEAIDYAVSHGAGVINLSWGTDAQSVTLADAIDRAGRRGVVVVCSAGNGGRDIESAPYYPASYSLPNMVSVAATDASDRLASWSNYGSAHVTIAAPGVDILTTKMNGGYWTISGTSASAPLVAGVAGLVRTMRPQLSSNNTVAAITSGARQVSSLTGKVSAGGIVNAAGALAALQSMDTAPAGYGNNGNGNGSGSSSAGGNGNGGGNGGNNHQHQAPPPSFSGHGGGGHGADGGFDVTPPPQTTGVPGTNLPNLDQARKLKSSIPQTTATIRSNIILPDCDVTCGGEIPSGGAGGYDPYLGTARNQPVNQTGQPGVDLGSRNFNWGASLVSLKGRAGMDLNIGLSYNSLVWTKQDSTIEYNADHGFPGPGFQLGFPTVQARYYDSQAGVWVYMMVTPSGGRVSMRQAGGTNVYEAQDGSYTQLIDNGGSMLVRATDGTQYTFLPSPASNGEFKCTQIKDRNGNFITIGYNGMGRPSTVIDTLGRTVSFNYTAQNYLDTITQSWNGGATHQWAKFDYDLPTINYYFPGLNVVAPPNNSSIPVLSKITFADASSYVFSYTGYGQVRAIEHFAADAHRLAYTSYDLPAGGTAQTDCPRFTYRADWAEEWNNGNEAQTHYSVDPGGGWTDETAPDGTRHRELFSTSGWRSGLTIGTEEYDAGGTKQKWTSTTWTQDNLYAGYQINPRPTDADIYDASGNHKRTHIDYTSYSLPSDVYEYDSNGTTVLRRTHTDYTFDAAYLNRRIIGLPTERDVYDGGTRLSKVGYQYDTGGGSSQWISNTGQATQHDYANYGTGFDVGRGNLSYVQRFDVNDPNNTYGTVVTSGIGYNITGSVTWRRDPLDHQTSIGYTDSNGGNTFAYPTTVTDPDGYQSTAQYRYDTGAVTRTQSPAPAGQTQGAIQLMTYDAVGRPDQVTTQNTGAYVRMVYPASQTIVNTYTTMTDAADEYYSAKVLDGRGQVRATGADHPGAPGYYDAQVTRFDAMGRAVQVSNPTQVNGTWQPAGDDVAGWVWTLQAYDWKGRPTVVTNPDGSTVETTYGGCGCAGGEVSTVRDERARRKRLTMDALGRLKEVVELQWDGTTPYATTAYSYNALDQLTQLNQAGQLRSMDYDGHGRLWHKTTPEQGQTTYGYNADDTVQSVTDARQAVQSFTYNNRGLVTGINYAAAGTAVATPNVTFGYDGAGNRTSMTDGQGSTTYAYDQLSRLTSEQRSFSGLGSYNLTYSYNRAGELTNITNPWNAQVGYGYDQTGRPSGVTGAGYGGVSTYANGFAYRAFGMKQMSYGNGRQLSMNYDNRLRMTKWDVSGVLGSNYQYTNYGENGGRVTFAGSIYDTTKSLDRSYNYDQVGRLFVARTGVEARADSGQGWDGGSYGAYSHGFGYDVFGNMTHREGWGGWNASYDATYTNNRRDGLTYDAAGNHVNDGGWYFQYDVAGRQTQASAGSYVLQQSYDGDGQRVKKTDDGQPTYYLRSSVLGGQVIAEINGNGTWQRGYVYLGGQMLATQQYGTINYVHQDPVTKSQRLTNTSGTETGTRIELDPFGGDTSASANGNSQPYKYTSYERDGNGSDYAMARSRNTWFSRFYQPDPYDGSYNMADPQSFNRYSYVQNDPVNKVDPTGLKETCIKADDGSTYCFDEKDVVHVYTFAPRWMPDFNLLGFYNQYRTHYVIEDRFSERGARDLKPPPTPIHKSVSVCGGFRVQGCLGCIIDDEGIKPTVGISVGASFPISPQVMRGPGNVPSGNFYVSGTFVPGFIGGSGSFPINRHPLRGAGAEGVLSLPQAGAGVTYVSSPLQGTTPSDWRMNPGNPNNSGSGHAFGGRCAY